MKLTASVYWIRLPYHSDIARQGYVGMTSLKPSRRFDRHNHNAQKRRNICVKLERAIRKYGRDNLIFQEIVRGSTDYCAEIERRLRPTKTIGWNLWPGGNKGILGFKASFDAKRKSNAAKFGRPVSAETRAKISLALMGNKCAIGAVRSPEMRAIYSAKNIGFKHTDEAKAKIGAASRARVVSMETRRKMSASAKKRAA